MGPRWHSACTVLALVVGFSAPALAQAGPLELSVGPAEHGWPVRVQVGPLLDDSALRSALDSALPLRFHLRIELWRNAILDRLAASDNISVALFHDPLSDGYTIETVNGEYRTESADEAQALLADLLRSDLRPQRSGRHYYLASLDVETLSLSDLDELRRWLRGDAGAAFEGPSSPVRAVERGLRRMLVRVIGLPTRRFEARTGTFRAGQS